MNFITTKIQASRAKVDAIIGVSNIGSQLVQIADNRVNFGAGGLDFRCNKIHLFLNFKYIDIFFETHRHIEHIVLLSVNDLCIKSNPLGFTYL